MKILNDVAIELRGITQIVEFQEKYMNFLLGFFSNVETYAEDGRMGRSDGSVFFDGRY